MATVARTEDELELIKQVEEINKQCIEAATFAKELVAEIGPRLKDEYGDLGEECVEQMEGIVTRIRRESQQYSNRYTTVINSQDPITDAFLKSAQKNKGSICELLNFTFELDGKQYDLFALCSEENHKDVAVSISAYANSRKTLSGLQGARVTNFLEEFESTSTTTSESDETSEVERGVAETVARLPKTPGPWLGSFSWTKPAGVWFGSETTPRLVSAAERQSGPEIARGAVAVSGLVSVICSPEDAAKFSTRGELVFVNPGRNVPFDTTTPAQYASANDVATPLVAQQSHQELVVMGAGMAGPGTVADPGWSPKDPAPWGIPEGAPVVFAPVPLEPAGDGMLPPMAVRGAYHPGDPADSGATPFAVLGLESAGSSQLSDKMLRRVTLGTYCGKNERGSGILVDLGACVV